MSDDLLFDVPLCDSPRLAWMKRIKEEYRIFSHNAPGGGEWMALSMIQCCDLLDGYCLTKEEKTDGVELMAGYCRLINEAGLLVDGYATEDEAIIALAEKSGWKLWNEEGRV